MLKLESKFNKMTKSFEEIFQRSSTLDGELAYCRWSCFVDWFYIARFVGFL